MTSLHKYGNLRNRMSLVLPASIFQQVARCRQYVLLLLQTLPSYPRITDLEHSGRL